MAAAIDGHDSVEARRTDTLAAGAGLCDPAAAARICRQGPAQVVALLRRGVAFDHHGGHLRLAREGAHSAARVVHAGGLADAGAWLAEITPGADPETDNLLLVARLTAAAADLRAESRGAHFRSDRPLPDPLHARRIAWAGPEPHLLPPPAARRPRALAMEAA
jgi:aspartate oxidase